MKTIELSAKKRLSKKAKLIIQNAIDTHEKYKKSYFWNVSGNAASRRNMESKFEGRDFIINLLEGKLYVTFSFSVSCKNVYYSMNVFLNDNKKDIRFLKKMLN